MRRPLSLDEICEVLDSDWLYDLLPGNGDDDYILQKLREAFDAKACGRKFAEPCRYCDDENAVPIVIRNGKPRHILPGSVDVPCKKEPRA